MRPRPRWLSARLWAHSVLISLLSWGERVEAGNTILRGGICCWDWGGSPPGGEQSPVEQAGSDRGGWVSWCRMSRNVLPCCLVLSCIAPSKVDSAEEEAGIQLQVELVRNLL